MPPLRSLNTITCRLRTREFKGKGYCLVASPLMMTGAPSVVFRM
jgi:hypothetical protein